MDIERRALYTSLRLNWLQDPTLAVEDWQVEDYREMPYSVLFERLRGCEVLLDRLSFLELANQYDSPEELCDQLLDEHSYEPRKQDRIYLVIFELWRRLVTDKPCLSIFCDELDYQIYLYDQDAVDNSETLQNSLANLQVILEENTDQGADPKSIFAYVSAACAHDIESFILDYTAEQVDDANLIYGNELFEGFCEYLTPSCWLELLRVRLLSQNDIKAANRLVKRLLEEDEEELDFYLEVLHFLAVDGDKYLFGMALTKCLPLLHTEEDLQDLIGLCLDYHQNRDHEKEVATLQRLVQERRRKSPSDPLERRNPVLDILKKITL